jgi:enoyl-CoA hydratase
MTAAVTVERDGPVTRVRLSRPHARNAVDGDTAAALADAFRAFDADDGAHVAVLWGAGGTFCAGADLKAIGGPDGIRAGPDGDGPMGPTRLRLAKPVIAAGTPWRGAWSWPCGATCGWWRRTRCSACSAGDGACR